MFGLAWTIILTLIGFSTFTTQQDPNCPEPYGFFPVANDYSAFYQCDDSVGVWTQCATGTLFDSNLGNCIPQEVHVSTHGFVCPQPDGLFQIDGDCSRFLACISNLAYVMNCPEDTLFNSNQQWCDDPANSTCY